MGELGLTYTEVFEIIPYRNLVLMQKDKLHICTGKKRVEVTEAELGIQFDN